jgi:hypothetical protein
MHILTIIKNDAIPAMGRQDGGKLSNVAEAASYFNFSNPQFWAAVESKVMEIIHNVDSQRFNLS